MKENEIKIYKTSENPLNYIEFLNDYYLPIINKNSYFLYLFLFNYKDIELTELNLLIKLNFNKDEYIESRKILEAIGLINTFKDESDYVIVINKVLSPSKFFSKTHLRALLLSSLKNDKDEFKKIEDKYISKYSLSGYTDISSSLFSVFKVEPSNDSKKLNFIKNDYDSNKIFSLSSFMSYIKANSQISSKSFSQEDYEKINNISKLYSLNEKEIANYIINFYDPLNKINKFNFNALEKEIIKDQMFVKKENISKESSSNDELVLYYKSLSPLDFLRNSLNGKEPSKLEKNIILTLSNDYGLNREKINAILDYTLKKDNNKLFKDSVITYLSPYLRSGKDDIYALLDSLYDTKSFNEVKKSHKEINLKEDNLIDKGNESEVKIDFDETDYDI